MRKMATVRMIDSIRPIPDADAIECAVVGGWTVVVKKGEYTPGDIAVYCEIDSWIPTEIAPFLSKGQEPKEFEGVKGERLRTVKLRGQLSQGLLLPVETTGSLHVVEWKCMGKSLAMDALDGNFDPLGLDVSDILGIKKYEPPIPAQLAGEVKGAFPGFIPKTDQERIQNLSAELEEWRVNSQWEVTEKLDGSSMTVYIRDGEVGVCSRNLELKRNKDNSLWKAVDRQGIEEILVSHATFDSEFSVALQGELIGEGIQGNPYKIKGQKFVLFDIYLINDGRYMTPAERHTFATMNDIDHVPVINAHGVIQGDIEAILKAAEGKSDLNNQTEREGLVFKREDGAASFKAISNKFLMKTGG